MFSASLASEMSRKSESPVVKYAGSSPRSSRADAAWFPTTCKTRPLWSAGEPADGAKQAALRTGDEHRLPWSVRAQAFRADDFELIMLCRRLYDLGGLKQKSRWVSPPPHRAGSCRLPFPQS